MLSSRLRRQSLRLLLPLLVAVAVLFIVPMHGLAQNPPPQTGGEAHLILPDLSQAEFLGINGRTLLMADWAFARSACCSVCSHTSSCAICRCTSRCGTFRRLIWETCKTYLLTQGKFLLILEIFIGVIILFYFGYFRAPRADPGHRDPAVQHPRHRAGATAWRGTASASTPSRIRGRPSPACAAFPYPCYQIPLRAGM